MTSINNFPNPSVVPDNMTISRKIHQQMMNKRNRWRPSELELAVLKLHFQKNQYPSKEEKEAILSSLEHQFGAKVQIEQLSRWFQHEREKAAKRNFKGNFKNTYRKFGKEELDYLQESFAKNNYPKVEEMMATAKRLNVNLSKIENWYKHNRRTLAKRGHFSLKTKKYFKKEELSYLVEMFENHPRPTKEQFLEIAEKLNCSESQIKNWYSNKRKKQKLIAKKHASEIIEPNFHQPDAALFSKTNVYPEFSSMPIQVPTINPALVPQVSGLSSAIPEQKTIVAPFIVSNPINSLTGLQQNQPIYNGFTSNGIPVLVIPTSVSNSSSMVVNTNIINNSNAYPLSTMNSAQDPTNANDIKTPNGFQEPKIINASLEPEKAKFMTPPPLIYPFSQPNPTAYPFLPTASLIPLNAFSQPQTQVPTPTPTLVQNQPQKLEQDIGSQQALNISNSHLLGAQRLTPIALNPGNLPNGFVPVQISAGNGISSYPIIHSLPDMMGSNGALNSDPYNKVVSGINPVAMGAVSPRKPIQVQYQTSLYLPFSNNNIYSQYPPMMVQQRPEVYVQGPMQNQMNLNMGSALPGGGMFGTR